MMPKFCTKCGNPLIEGDKFCRKCGTPVAVREEVPAAPQAPAAQWNNAPAPEPQWNDAPAAGENPEGTVLWADILTPLSDKKSVISAEIRLPLGDVLRGCTRIVDFGTGEKFEIVIPPGLSPGDVLVVQDTGIKNPDTGEPCDFELRIAMA